MGTSPEGRGKQKFSLQRHKPGDGVQSPKAEGTGLSRLLNLVPLVQLKGKSLVSKQQPCKQHILLNYSLFPKKVCNQERAMCKAQGEDPPVEQKHSDNPQPYH